MIHIIVMYSPDETHAVIDNFCMGMDIFFVPGYRTGGIACCHARFRVLFFNAKCVSVASWLAAGKFIRPWRIA